LLDRYPRELSGGQRQRVAMGRAIVRDPQVFLFDEPLSNLDAKLRVHMRTEIKDLHQRLGTTMVYVTHDQIEAMTMASHVGVLDCGRLVQFGAPREIYENPVSAYVATRLGQPRINLLPASLFAGAPPGATQIGLRPEHIRQGAGQAATVRRVEHLGDQTRLHLTLAGHELITLTDPHSPYSPGDTLAIQPDKPLWFDASGTRVH
jgi:multiple sugar transport system ATP-binding protein